MPSLTESSVDGIAPGAGGQGARKVILARDLGVGDLRWSEEGRILQGPRGLSVMFRHLVNVHFALAAFHVAS